MKALKFEGRSDEEVRFHLELLKDAGLIDQPAPIEPFPGGVRFEVGRRLTHSGHDFLDSVRDEDIWDKTQEGMKKAGGFSLDLVKALSKGLIKKNIEKYTGVEIDL